jgi:hypothetical protein
MTGPDKALATIRKLLAKAEDPGVTPAEADAYNTKAAELIAAYGIDRALLAEDAPGTDLPGDKIITLDPPYARDKADLLTGVAYALRCKVVLRRRWQKGRKVASIHLFGYGSDLERTELLFTSLLVQAAHGMASAVIPWNEHPAAYRRSWMAGFTIAITARLRAAERRAEQHAEHDQATSTGRSVSLVLVGRAERIDQLVSATYPKLQNGQARHLSGTGRAHGYQAGQRADIGTTRIRTAPGPAINRGGS